MAFMARLRTAAGESPLALRLRFMSWLRPVRRKWTPAAAVSAVAAAQRGRNGGFFNLGAVSPKGNAAKKPPLSPETAAKEVGVPGAGRPPPPRERSAPPARATELMPRAEPTRCARSGLPHPRDAGRLTTHLGGIIMKRPSRRSPYLVAAGALSILLGLTGAWSQTARTVKIVVPYPAGGTAD